MVAFIFCRSCDIETIYDKVKAIEEKLPQQIIYLTNTVYITNFTGKEGLTL